MTPNSDAFNHRLNCFKWKSTHSLPFTFNIHISNNNTLRHFVSGDREHEPVSYVPVIARNPPRYYSVRKAKKKYIYIHKKLGRSEPVPRKNWTHERRLLYTRIVLKCLAWKMAKAKSNENRRRLPE